MKVFLLMLLCCMPVYGQTKDDKSNNVKKNTRNIVKKKSTKMARNLVENKSVKKSLSKNENTESVVTEDNFYTQFDFEDEKSTGIIPEKYVKKFQQLTKESERLHLLDVSSRKQEANKLFLQAAQEGADIFIDFLLKQEADLNYQDKQGRTALSYAAAMGHDSFVRLLIQAGSAIELQDSQGMRPVHHAVSFGHNAVLSVLIDAKVNLDSRDNLGRNPVLLAAFYDEVEVLQLLIDANAPLDKIDRFGFSALHTAADQGRLEALKLLIKAGTPLEAKTKKGQTALTIAVRSEAPEKERLKVITALLSAGSSQRTQDLEKRTPLIWAVLLDRFKETQVLLQKSSIALEIPDHLEMTPLLWGAYQSSEAVLKELLQKGADVAAKDKQGRGLRELSEISNENIRLFLQQKRSVRLK